jgi:hypothetical protein
MGRCDQGLQILGPPVPGLGSEEKNTVVSPVAGSGELGDWHQLDGRDSQVRQMIEPIDDTSEVTAACERADV